MKEEKFKVIEFIRRLIVAIDEELNNFPKKDIEIKNRIRTNSYDILELAYEANATSDDKIKQRLLEKIIAKIKIVDFLLNLAHDKMLINHKRYIKFGERMDDIIKYSSGWLNSLAKK